MEKYWSNCPFKKICAIDFKDESSANILSYFDEVIEIGTPSVAGKNMNRIQTALRHITTPYVMLLQDDFFLYDFVRNEDLESTLSFAKEHHAGSISLLYKHRKSVDFLAPPSAPAKLRLCPKDEPYRISMLNIFWDTAYLQKIADRYDSPSDFERQGSFLSATLDRPLYTILSGREIYPMLDAINRGKWRLGMLEFLKKEKIFYNKEKWPEPSTREKCIMHLRNFIYSLSPKIVTKLVAHSPFRKRH